MQHLKVSGAVRPLKWSFGVKWLSAGSSWNRLASARPAKASRASVTCRIATGHVYFQAHLHKIGPDTDQGP